jgi:voltage-gated sodium channel
MDWSNAPVPPAKEANLFAEVNELRKKKKEEPIDENAKYKDNVIGRTAGANWFQSVTFFFIILNALYIGFDADYTARNDKPADLYSAETPWGFIFMENLFCTYFTVEVMIRFAAYKRKRDSLTDWWFVFDGTLVTLMVLETWLFPIFDLGSELSKFSVLRLLRLLRITRVARLMKKVPELMIIVKGIGASARSVLSVSVLQILIVYVWSILFVTEYHEKAATEEGSLDPAGLDGDPGAGCVHYYFGSMSKSIFSLFVFGTILDDVTQVTDCIRQHGKDSNESYAMMLILFILFILVSSFTLLNMLIGILVEVVQATADREKTQAVEDQVKESMTSLFDSLDVDGNGLVSEEEFMNMRDNESVSQALEDMDISDSHFNKYCEIFFQEANDTGGPPVKLSFETVINMVLRLAPGNNVNALDFSLLQASIDNTQESLKERIANLHSMILALNKTSSNSRPQGKNLLSVEPAWGEDQSMRQLGQGDLPPPQPLSDTMGNTPSMMSMEMSQYGAMVPRPGTAGTAEDPLGPSSKWSLDMFIRTPSHEIIAELEKRLGVLPVQSSIYEINKDFRVSSPPATEIEPEQAPHPLGIQDG